MTPTTTPRRRFEGCVVLITGGTSGIGAATAVQFAHEGAEVLVTGRNEARGVEIASSHDNIQFHQVDVTDRVAIDALMGTIESTFGRLDVVVNSAGVVNARPFASMSTRHWQEMIDTNLTGAFHVSQAALPLLRATVARGSAKSTSIVNLSSLNGLRVDPGLSAYGSAKAALIALTEGMAIELIESGVRVNCVSPGAIDTPMSSSTADDAENSEAFTSAIPAGRYGTADEVAAAILFVASHEASFMIGANLVIDGGATLPSRHPDLLSMFNMER
jgi:meso-butanediol dehydrogenase/(S,S)-butanediol dehydrogenase/diacetyl reductase